MKLKERLKQSTFLVNLYRIKMTFSVFFRFKILYFFKSWGWFISDYRKYKSKNKNEHFEKIVLQPCLTDKTTFTPLDPIYFYQDTWLAKKIFQNPPKHHYDVGSKATTIGLISQFVPTTMIDIRPLPFTLDNLFFKEGSILELPYENESIDSLSSICVIEHIGLGRYGDPLDDFGSEKSFKEMKRVLKSGGNFYFTVPVDGENQVYFNAHRAFTRAYILEFFNDMQLQEEVYLYGNTLYDEYHSEKGFGTGFFHFTKK